MLRRWSELILLLLIRLSTLAHIIPASRTRQPPAALWAHVEAINAAEPHLYGGAMLRTRYGAILSGAPHYATSRYRSRRRITELAARAAVAARRQPLRP